MRAILSQPLFHHFSLYKQTERDLKSIVILCTVKTGGRYVLIGSVYLFLSVARMKSRTI